MLAKSEKPVRDAVLSALTLGDNALATKLLDDWKPTTIEYRAEKLALRGFVSARRGNRSEYCRLARQAVQLCSTPLTVYHLGLALPLWKRGNFMADTKILAPQRLTNNDSEAKQADELLIERLKVDHEFTTRLLLNAGPTILSLQ